MFKANLIILQIVKDQADHAHDLLFVREVEDLGDVLDEVQLEVLEQMDGELVMAKDPERAADVVSDLTVLLALVDEQRAQCHEATLLDELFGNLIDAQQVHQTMRVRDLRQGLRLTLAREEEVEEALSIVLERAFVSKAREADQLGQSVGCQITLLAHAGFNLLVKEATEDADAVELFVRVA